MGRRSRRHRDAPPPRLPHRDADGVASIVVECALPRLELQRCLRDDAEQLGRRVLQQRLPAAIQHDAEEWLSR